MMIQSVPFLVSPLLIIIEFLITSQIQPSVNLTTTVRNEQGLAIKTIRQTTKAGEFSYEWDGKMIEAIILRTQPLT